MVTLAKAIAAAVVVMVAAITTTTTAMGHVPVLLSSVQTLTFIDGAMTTGRRTAPIPQLKCASSPDPALNPTSVQCYNKGISDLGNVQWECKANMDSRVQFAWTNVNCEGFNYPEDPYILAGSCSLSYSLKYAPGRQPQQHQQQQQQQQYQYYAQQQQQQTENYRGEVPDNKGYYKSYHPEKKHGGISHFLKTVIFCGVAGLIFVYITKCFKSNNDAGRRRIIRNGGGDDDNSNGNYHHSGGGNGGNGGYNGGGNNRNNKNNGGNSSCGYGYQQRGTSQSTSYSSGTSLNGGSIGGVGTAAAALGVVGAIGLHALDRRQEEQNRRRFEQQQQQQQQYYYQQQQQYPQYSQIPSAPPPPPPSTQSYGYPQQTVYPRDEEQRSYADTSRR